MLCGSRCRRLDRMERSLHSVESAVDLIHRLIADRMGGISPGGAWSGGASEWSRTRQPNWQILNPVQSAYHSSLNTLLPTKRPYDHSTVADHSQPHKPHKRCTTPVFASPATDAQAWLKLIMSPVRSSQTDSCSRLQRATTTTTTASRGQPRFRSRRSRRRRRWRVTSSTHRTSKTLPTRLLLRSAQTSALLSRARQPTL